MEIIETKVKMTPSASEEMIRYSPNYRCVYWILVIILSSYPVYLHIEAMKSNALLTITPEQLTRLNNESLLSSIVSIVVLLLLLQLFWKTIFIKLLGRKMYKFHQQKNMMVLYIGFNRRKNRFLLGRNQVEYVTNKRPRIVSTRDNYLFYLRKGFLKEDTFFLPKQGDELHKKTVQEIINHFQNKENMSIKKHQ